ncbi:hypothetical protein [Nakamurella lactea]|uniref:hypothetical protein n=1 Tax=Nakamurella lactea TaxID=459515 RepID=UPI00041D1DF9|nr:hypothetical protein [Nakamurella lactea]
MSLLGAIGIIVGTLLPWISAGFMSYTPPLFSSDAGLFFVLGVIVAVVALVWLLGNAGGLRWLCVALGLLGLALAIFEMVRLTSTAPEMVSLGVGLILCAVGGAVAAVGGAIR